MAGVAAGAAVKAFTGLTGMAVAKVVFLQLDYGKTSLYGEDIKTMDCGHL
jgi:hypothetical protein